MAGSSIHIDSLSLVRDGRSILNDCSLEIPAGQCVVMTGPSGAGKSTLLRCVLGFDWGDSGKIFIEGDELTAKDIWSFRRKIAYVTQEPDLGNGTVGEVIEKPFSYRANHDIRERVALRKEMFAQLSLSEGLVDKDVTTLSGGEKQRVAIIKAMLLDRDILLLDEITSALDVDSRRAVVEMLGASGATMLIVSHDSMMQELGRVIRFDGKGGVA